MANVSKADLTALTKGIAGLTTLLEGLAPVASAEAPVVSEEVTYSDPVSQKLDEVEAQLVEQLANPVHKIVRGRRGATVIDVTAESIAQLLELRKSRAKYRTQYNIR
tara:strand:- start:92 stop:412 length:321 start_codon:yes stop_codon:yes gene_type:complete